jgi:hypothetical protein
MNVAVTSTAAELIHDRQWWAEQAAHDWPAVRDDARTLMAVAVGEISPMDTFEKACREADCKAASRPVDARALRARRLLDDGTSYERAYGEILRDLPAPEALVEALMYSLRRGVNELTQPDALRRLSVMDRDQLKDICRRVQAFGSRIAEPWSADAVDALISAWRKSREPSHKTS